MRARGLPLRSNTLRLKSSPKLSDALLKASCKSCTSNNIFFLQNLYLKQMEL